MNDEKDIVLLLGSGGMMGIFTAGALEVINEKFRHRIAGVYAISSGADVGAYFVSGQVRVPYTFFMSYLTRKDFIRGNWIPYLYKIFFGRKHSRIKDFINTEYVVEVARHSPCMLDLEAFRASPIEFFVKVIRVRDGHAEYLPAKEALFQKLRATSQCGPFSTEAVEISGEQYIDGDTLLSNLDVELAVRFKDKTIIYIEPSGPLRFFRKLILFPFYLLAGVALTKLFGSSIGIRYIDELFTDPVERVKVAHNVICIQNNKSASLFCTDPAKLAWHYRYGKTEAQRILSNFT